jgi:CheY-like chemotaxis protein
MKILVCEDDEIVLKVIQVALRGHNTDAVYVRDGRKALQLLREKNDFDMIITDIHMPYHNGDEILHLVRQEQKKTIPLIMVSSDTEEEVIKLALKSGVTEFIEKPVDADKIKKKLKKYLPA